MITSYWLLDIFLTALFIYLVVCALVFFLQSRLIFLPTVESPEFVYKLATPHKEWSMETPNGGFINGLLITPQNSKGMVFYLHGNAGSIKRWRFMAEEISTYGYDVCILDYRGYGKSRGKKKELWMHEDVKFCFDEISKSYEGKPVIIYGRSLGSGFATRLAAYRKVDGLILETPFYSLLDVASSYFPFLPVKLLLRFRFRSDNHIKRVKYPCIIFHGTRDRVVPYSSALKIYAKVSDQENFKMITLQGARHNNLNAYPLFRDELKNFLSSE